MRHLVPCLLLVAACGGKSKPAAPLPSNDGDQVAAADSGGDTYGDEWGGDYGGVGYGDGYDYGSMGGDSYGGSYNYTPPAPTPPNIAGTWATACAATAKKDFTTLTFVNTAEGRWDLTAATFSDAACTKRKSALHLGGAYAFGGQSTNVPTAWEGNFTFEARDLTADDAKTAKALGKLCGIKKMKAGATVDLHAKGCPKLGLRPAADCAADFDLVALEGDVLRFGVRPADNDMCTAEKRPTALETTADIVFQYQPTGVPECDAMIEGYKSYMRCPAMPADQKGYVFDAIRQMAGQAAQMGAATCQQVTDALKQGLAAMGC
jgi:hypothetical protein